MEWTSKKKLRQRIEALQKERNDEYDRGYKAAGRILFGCEAEIRALKDYIAVTQGNKTIPYKKGYKEGFSIGLELGEMIGRKKARIIFGFTSTEDMWLEAEWNHYEGVLIDDPDSIPPYKITVRRKEQK